MDRDDPASTQATDKNTKTPAAKPTSKAAKRVTPDWERIELDYRAGIKSLREIADGSGVSHVSISKRAKKMGWVKDLSSKIQAKADELVNKATVNTPVNTASAVSERETIEANALAVADVKLAHRKDISRSRRLVMNLLSELEQQTDPDTLADLQELGILMRSENKSGQDRINDLYHKVISLTSRATTSKTLADALKSLVALERQAYGMDDKDTSTADALTTLLHGISQSSGNAFAPVAQDPEHED